MAETLTRERSGDRPVVDRQHMPHKLDGGIGVRATIGVIVLASDQTIEYEFRRVMALPGIGLYQTRIFNAATITPESLKEMEGGLKDATALILPGMPLDVVAFGCTSGAMTIGEDRVAELIREVRPGVACTSPMRATLIALKALGLRRIAMLTPYIESITAAMRQYVQADGVAVPVVGSFNEIDDNRVGRISPASVRAAALELGGSDLVDGVFVSCSSIRLLDQICALEAELGKPVVTSNSAMAWHCLRLAGIDDALPQFGGLYTRPAP